MIDAVIGKVYKQNGWGMDFEYAWLEGNDVKTGFAKLPWRAVNGQQDVKLFDGAYRLDLEEARESGFLRESKSPLQKFRR